MKYQLDLAGNYTDHRRFDSFEAAKKEFGEIPAHTRTNSDSIVETNDEGTELINRWIPDRGWEFGPLR